jgi:hypothetical protein
MLDAVSTSTVGSQSIRASIGYGSREILARFADRYHITYPMLSDHGSLIIHKFGILNRNVPSGTRFYGIPFRGSIWSEPMAPCVTNFLPDYQTRRIGGAVERMRHPRR